MQRGNVSQSPSAQIHKVWTSLKNMLGISTSWTFSVYEWQRADALTPQSWEWWSRPGAHPAPAPPPHRPLALPWCPSLRGLSSPPGSPCVDAQDESADDPGYTCVYRRKHVLSHPFTQQYASQWTDGFHGCKTMDVATGFVYFCYNLQT